MKTKQLTLDEIIGRNINRLRKLTNLSQEDVAADLGIHQTALSRIESGQQRLLACQLYWLSKVFKKEMSEFFEVVL